MARTRDQHKSGTPSKPRGQQTGFAGNPDQNREEMEKTPAVSGRRKQGNRMIADASEQHVASDATTPSTNTPSVPAVIPPVRSDSGGERVFKRRLQKKRSGA